MSRIQAQANKLWQIIQAPETFSKYQSAVLVTWDILREIFLLLWLGFLWVAVLADRSISLGQSARIWLDNQKQSTHDRSAAEIGKALLSAGAKGLAVAVAQAKQQLGIPIVLETKSQPAVSSAKSEPAVPAAKSESEIPDNGLTESKEPAEIG